ncbi:MAG: hypothetical protein M1835_007457 [Candelina submexicana]|nr:MAG: hypothetical protein M1835_007457 [Candelina submexicana]
MSSMPAWLNDAPVAQSNNAFNFPPDSQSGSGILDPSMAYPQAPSSFDVTALQDQQYQQRMHNGHARNASPAFHNPVYSVPSIVPSKRPRPREDSIGASPRQTPNTIPRSPSQTPLPHQVPYSGFQGSQQQFHAPTPYQHLQHAGSANASPSPILQNQQFRAPIAPQRVQSASPNMFSPAGQNFPSQISPSQSDHGSRVNTPQNGAAGYTPSLQYGTGYGQHFTPPPQLTSAGSQGSLAAQHAASSLNAQQQQQQQHQNAQRMLQMRQLQASNLAAQYRYQNSAPNPSSNAPGSAHTPQLGGGPRPTQTMIRPNNISEVINGFTQFMHARGQPVNMYPMVADRKISLMQLYACVMKYGGSKKVAAMGSWAQVAAALQFPPMQYPTAAQEIKEHYDRYLAAYEGFLLHTQRRTAMGDQGQAAQPPHPSGISSIQQQMSPVSQVPTPSQDSQPLHYVQAQQQAQSQQQHTPIKQAAPLQDPTRHSSPNGYITPQQNQPQNSQQSVYAHQRSNAPRLPGTTPPQYQQLTGQSNSVLPTDNAAGHGTTSSPSVPPEAKTLATQKRPQVQSNFVPKARALDTHGGIDVAILSQLGSDLVHIKPSAPTFSELGVIDIHALTMSLRSGLHAEVRLALDTLTTLSVEPRFQLSLESCDDLVETLIDCAEVQVDALAESSTEVSDVMLISPYEEVVRGCRSEIETLQDVPEVCSLDYELDRAVDRLICITTILRNLSFYETNHTLLADAVVVKFLSTVIRYLGTRNMLLRTHINTLDFMKDIVIYLSNLSQMMDLPGKEEALCLLHFLISFAPCPPPTTPGSEDVMFSSYQPSIHRYLPPAVDSLAKLLARDEPNRAFYKAIFMGDSSSSPPFDLLTRTFALAISPIPEHARGNLVPAVEARKPYLVQGMLAAEILANIAPGPEHRLARSWLSSEDGFALSLLRLVCLLSTDRSPPGRQPSSGRSGDQDPQSYGMITHRGMAVLRRLAEKTQNPEVPAINFPVGVLPKKESLLGALLTPNIDLNVVRQLCVYSGLDY